MTKQELREMIKEEFDKVIGDNINKSLRDSDLFKKEKNKLFSAFGGPEDNKSGFSYNKKAKDLFNNDNDKAGFESLGHVLLAIKHNDYEKLQRLEKDMTTGTGEAGGFLLPSAFSNEIIDVMLEEEICRKRCKVYSIDKGKGNSLTIPAVNDYDHSSNIAGITTYWKGETSAYTESANVKIRQIALKLNKLTVLVDCSEELVEDSAVKTENLLSSIFAKALAFEIDNCVLSDSGSGAGKPLSITNGDCNIEVSKQDGQDADTIVVENITDMIGRIHPASFKNSLWLSSLSNLSELLRLNLPIGAGGSWYHAFNESNGIWRLFSRPVEFTEHCSVLGDAGNLQLIDLKRYAMLLRGDGISVRSDSSLGFKSDIVSFKASIRIDGQPIDNSTLTLKDGSTTVSPFIKLGTV
jgi:HK97 family phage major capsid protein